MKRFFVLLTFSLLTLAATAQDGAPTPTPAAEVAAKQAADERYERMAADIQALQAANEALQTKLTALGQQLQDLRNQVTQSAGSFSTPDDLKHLADKIQEVDRKREDDKQAIAEEIRKSIGELKHALADSPLPAAFPRRDRPRPARRPTPKRDLFTKSRMATVSPPSSKPTTQILQARE